MLVPEGRRTELAPNQIGQLTLDLETVRASWHHVHTLAHRVWSGGTIARITQVIACVPVGRPVTREPFPQRHWTARGLEGAPSGTS